VDEGLGAALAVLSGAFGWSPSGATHDNKGNSMLYAIHYTTRATAVSKADTSALMAEFGERGEVAGAIAHYVYPGGGGIVIAEQDDPKVIYEAAVAYAEWLDFDIKPALTVEDAVPIILANLA